VAYTRMDDTRAKIGPTYQLTSLRQDYAQRRLGPQAIAARGVQTPVSLLEGKAREVRSKVGARHQSLPNQDLPLLLQRLRQLHRSMRSALDP